MHDSTLLALLQLRLLVGYLGERAQYGWWSTGFFEGPSPAFLEPAFPKTFRLARYRGVLEAARRVHDERLSVGCFHLFRLPEELEQDLGDIARGQAGSSTIDDLASTRDNALTALQDAAGDQPIPAAEGPLQVGRIIDLLAGTTAAPIAGAYLGAFRAGVQAYPYLAS